jgi:hypothetical protein
VAEPLLAPIWMSVDYSNAHGPIWYMVLPVNATSSSHRKIAKSLTAANKQPKISLVYGVQAKWQIDGS